jgi:hypothetical protein
VTASRGLTASELEAIGAEVHDRMTEIVLANEDEISGLFAHASPKPVCACAHSRTSLRGI